MAYGLTVKVIDADLNEPIQNAEVYLYKDTSNPVDPSTTPDFHGFTDANGEFSITTDGVYLFGIGVILEGYKPAEKCCVPPEGWEDVWTCWSSAASSDPPNTFVARLIRAEEEAAPSGIETTIQMANQMVSLMMTLMVIVMIVSLTTSFL